MKKAFIILAIAFLVLFTPVSDTSAEGIVGNIAEGLASAIALVFVGLLLTVSTAILAIASFGLQQSIDPAFIRVPYTSGGVIDVAWPIVRDFANMLLVLILIFIGLGTALRLGDYDARKAIPRLVGIALLINFTPVIMGFIVDVSNIIMNFFLEGFLGAQALQNVFSHLSEVVASDAPSFLGAFNFAFVAKILALSIFNFVTAIIFFLFATLFLVRRVVIWLLVIISPLAFVAYILPATKGYFNKWWEQFFQWSTVGIFASFFLWLGDQVIALASRGGFVSEAPNNTFVVGAFINMFNQAMPFFIADLVLLIGFFMGLQSNAIGFNAVKSYSFGQQRFVRDKTGAFLKRFKDEKLMQSTLLQGRPGKPEEGLANKLASFSPGLLTPRWGEKQDGVTAAFKRTGAWATRAALTPLTGGVRKVGRGIGSDAMTEQKQIIARATQESRPWDVPTVVSRLKDHSVSQADKVGYLHRLITDFDVGDAMKLGLTSEEVSQIRESAKRRGEQHEIDVAFPELTRKDAEERVVRERAEANENARQANVNRKRMKLAGPDLPILPEIEDLPKDEQERLFREGFQDNFRKLFANHPERAAWISPGQITPEVGEAMLKFFDGRQMGHFARGAGGTGFEELQKSLDRLTAEYTARTGTPITKEAFLEMINPILHRYAQSNAGQDIALDIT